MMISLREYKGEQLTQEEVDLLEMFDTVRKQQAAVGVAVLEIAIAIETMCNGRFDGNC